MKKSKYTAPVEWAKKWSKNNVRVLKFEEQGKDWDAETCRLQASICKDFSITHSILNNQFLSLKP